MKGDTIARVRRQQMTARTNRANQTWPTISDAKHRAAYEAEKNATLRWALDAMATRTQDTVGAPLQAP